jgi:hypothetical protein
LVYSRINSDARKRKHNILPSNSNITGS